MKQNFFHLNQINKLVVNDKYTNKYLWKQFKKHTKKNENELFFFSIYDEF
jgi:hypothetical protein